MRKKSQKLKERKKNFFLKFFFKKNACLIKNKHETLYKNIQYLCICTKGKENQVSKSIQKKSIFPSFYLQMIDISINLKKTEKYNMYILFDASRELKRENGKTVRHVVFIIVLVVFYSGIEYLMLMMNFK